jgi:hypothetical protein
MSERCPTCGQIIALQSQGGEARAAKLTPEQRKEIARLGGLKRAENRRAREKADQ